MDRRDAARERGDWYEELDAGRLRARVTVYLEPTEEEENDPEFSEEQEVWVPIKFEVCGTCDGKGKHVNPSIDAHGISPEEFAEDPDFKEEYMNGTYDVTCYECHGRTTVPELDEDRCDKRILEALHDRWQGEADDRATMRAETGHGWY